MPYEKIRDILLNHIGKENMIPAPEIAEQIGVIPGPSGVNIREMIFKAIKRYKLPVAAGNRGYFLLRENDEGELKRYTRSLHGRSIKNFERAALIKMFFEEYYNKEELELVNEMIDAEFDEDEEE